MELVAGCYEQVLFGFAARPGEACGLTPDFTNHAHTASLSAVAVNSKYVVTGSRDESIQIYDMRKKVEHGALLQHNGTITCLEFYGTAHLLSGAEDGLICIWNTKRWECLKSIKAHKGHVTSLSIHPSGKLALSVGTDKTLRTWNLVEGRSAFIKNLKQNAHIIKWSPNGEKYVTVITNKVDIYKLDTASITGTITIEKRISSIRFITDSVLAIAGDDEIIRFYSCDSQKCLCEFKAHENRIKDIYSFEREGQHVIVTASSDGYIKVWNLDLNKKNINQIVECFVIIINFKPLYTYVCLHVFYAPVCFGIFYFLLTKLLRLEKILKIIKSITILCTFISCIFKQF
uniref:PAK1 interacting protein 1 n=1 Tax=Pavo cristatus TaxID=9049 RepID=A0A8C9G2F7_PAVCR